MKKDKLKELFEENEIKNMHQAKGGEGGDSTTEPCYTNTAQTAGDVGNCDTDTGASKDPLGSLGPIVPGGSGGG